MIFQGTVLGPQLWNLFFADAANAIKERLYEEVIYADDLSAFKIVPSDISDENAKKSLANVQKELHRWGAANSVTFDPSKESVHVLSRLDPHGQDFRMLGVSFDCKLDMEGAIRAIAGKARWKISMLLRSKRTFDIENLIVQYKQQVLSKIEYSSSAIYHATTTALLHIDKLQDNFLLDLGITKEAALIDFSLAPLPTRRDIALLGILHRAAIGEGPPQFQTYFRRQPGSLRLFDILEHKQPSLLMRRSIWGLVRIYNDLGGSLKCATVKDFQKHLQDRLKRVVQNKVWEDWTYFYAPRRSPAATPSGGKDAGISGRDDAGGEGGQDRGG